MGMAFLTMGAGLFLTLRLGFFQFTHFHKAVSGVFKGAKRKGGVSSFQALATALGGSIGTANIAGVAGALVLGGPGAVFWMWAAALLGMATKLTEILLAVKYRDTSVDPPVGGAFYCIERGLGRRFRPLASVFAFACVMASAIGTALVQPNTIAEAFFGLVRAASLPISRIAAGTVSGVFAALLTFAVISGGAKRIGRFSERAVPVMAGLYVFAAAFIIIVNRERLLPALSSIFRSAFGLPQAAGGAAGYGLGRALKVGAARGVYSNEAGVGSAPMAHAASSETDPVKQGMLGIFEVFFDTIVMCTLTALAVLTSGAPLSGEGMALAASAFSSVFGEGASSLFLSLAILLFAFTSLVGWSLYMDRSAYYLWGGRGVSVCRVLFLLLIPVGSVIPAGPAWRLGVVFNYLMALPNLIALVLLSGDARREIAVYKMFEMRSRMGYNKG